MKIVGAIILLIVAIWGMITITNDRKCPKCRSKNIRLTEIEEDKEKQKLNNKYVCLDCGNNFIK